jgi:hypothetical protein
MLLNLFINSLIIPVSTTTLLIAFERSCNGIYAISDERFNKLLYQGNKSLALYISEQKPFFRSCLNFLSKERKFTTHSWFSILCIEEKESVFPVPFKGHIFLPFHHSHWHFAHLFTRKHGNWKKRKRVFIDSKLPCNVILPSLEKEALISFWWLNLHAPTYIHTHVFSSMLRRIIGSNGDDDTTDEITNGNVKKDSTRIHTGGCSLMSIIVIISKPLPCCKTGAVVSVTKTVNRITC